MGGGGAEDKDTALKSVFSALEVGAEEAGRSADFEYSWGRMLGIARGQLVGGGRMEGWMGGSSGSVEVFDFTSEESRA